MIQYDKDGATLFYIDDTGNKVSATVFDGQKYSLLDGIMLQQIAAVAENNHAADIYNQQLQQAQTSVSAGRPADAPQKPLQHVVSDTGVSTYVPFSPPLPDLTPLQNVKPSSGQIAQPTVDTQAVMYAMLTAIYRKMFPSG